MNKTFQVVTEDLRNATVKEINAIIKQMNESLNFHLYSKGKKDELVFRFANFLSKLVEAKKKNSLTVITHIVNETVPTKLAWKYEDNEIKVKMFSKVIKSSIEKELVFKPSPFFLPVSKLCSTKLLPTSISIKQTRRFQFKLTEEHRRLLASSNTTEEGSLYQIRFYCARFADTYTGLSVEFPSICEIRVNGSTVPGNSLRCLKGKPGTVNPPDITIMTRKKETNNIEFKYVNNETTFIANAYIVKRTTVAELIHIMEKKNILSKEKVLEKLQQKKEEDEIVMESETLSTRDPLVFTRIITPIRSNSCNHLQCFDATIYLTMNEQTPTWACPVCYQKIENWTDLVIDEYFLEILSNTPSHISSVLVEPNGNITIVDENPDLAIEDEEDDSLQKEEEREVITILLDDDDEVPIRDKKTNNNTHQKQASINTNNIPVVECVSQNIAKRKRPISDTGSNKQSQPKIQHSSVIDLTLDSDGEDIVEIVNNTSQASSIVVNDNTINDETKSDQILPLETLYDKPPFTKENPQPANFLNLCNYI